MVLMAARGDPSFSRLWVDHTQSLHGHSELVWIDVTPLIGTNTVGARRVDIQRNSKCVAG